MGEIFTKEPFRLINPIDWCQVDKCLLGAGVSFIYCLMQTILGFWFEFNPDHAPFINQEVLAILNRFLLGCTIFLGIMTGYILWLRRFTSESPALEKFFIFMVGMPVLVLIYFNGALVSSAVLAMVAISVMGFFLFNTKIIFLALAFTASIFTVLGIAYGFGSLPHSPLYTGVPDIVDAKRWVVSQYIVGMYPLSMAIVTTVYFLKGLQDREERITHLSRIDGLTKVWNRRYLMELFEREERVSNRNLKPLSFMMLDLDFFKRINDEHGHQVGDIALSQAATAIKDSIRNTDFVGRYGGEEFAVILPSCDTEEAIKVAERCRKKIEKMTVQHESAYIKLTVSIGLATAANIQNSSQRALMEVADIALYESKAGGRNRTTFKNI